MKTDTAADLKEAADIEERSGGSKTTVASLRRGAIEIERLQRVWNAARGQADVVYKRLMPEVTRLRALVKDLYDPDPCHFDHHGYCQAHGWLSLDPPCPHKLAQDLLSEGEEQAAEDITKD